MDTISLLPPTQAALNLTATCFIIAAFYHIRRNNRRAHRASMIAALIVSTLFLASYLYYHSEVGYVPFQGVSFIRPVYFFILFSHIVLAVLIVPLILITLTLAIRKGFSWHRRIARWTLPLWLYVSVTGVLIYLLAFHLPDGLKAI